MRDADGRAMALRVVRCEAKIVGGRLEIKNIAGTEEDIPADLIVSAIGQAVDFTGLDEFNNGKGGINADRNYQVQGQPGVFVGGDVVRPHLLTTAIGHGAIAADGIERFLRGEPLEKRPKIDVHSFDLKRKMVEKGLTFSEVQEPIRGTDASTARSTTSTTAPTATSFRTRNCSSATSPTPPGTGARSSRWTRSRRWATSRSACCR